MKKKVAIFLIVIVLLLLLLFILYLLFGREKSFTITFDTDGGTNISSITIKNGETIKLPNNPTKDGYTFIGWVNENNNIVTNGLKLSKDTTLKATWIDNNAEVIKIIFDTNGGNNIDNIMMEKDKTILLPVEPTKNGYIFYGWIDENGNITLTDMTITTDMTLKAYWIKKDAKTWTISFDTDGGNSINDIVVENGKIIVLPINPTKEGYIFAGWVDENGKYITKDTIVKNKITLKATWKKPYTCPDSCTPIEDGSKCSKDVTSEISTTLSCPSGYNLKNGMCVGTRYAANSISVSPWWACNSSSEYMYDEIDESGLGAMMWCEPRINPTQNKVCPSGYMQNGNICKKTEIISCEAN